MTVNNPKPVMLMPPVLGTTWHVALSWKVLGDENFRATSRRPLTPENSARMTDVVAKTQWVESLMERSGKSQAEIEILVLGASHA